MHKEQRLTVEELALRNEALREKMTTIHSDWELAVISSDVNLYYFTGTMQRGILLIEREEKAVFWVRRSIERARGKLFF
jgi:Xaa-Pro aminopeptidase